MQGHAEKCVEKYLELAGMDISDLKPVGTPNTDDHAIPANEFVLKALFFARMTRPDLLQTVNCLARCVTKWTVACDRHLLK